MTRVGRQQPGGPDAASPTVTRREFETAQVLYPLAIAGAVAGVAALVTVGVLRVKTPVASVAALPLQGGALVTMRGVF